MTGDVKQTLKKYDTNHVSKLFKGAASLGTGDTRLASLVAELCWFQHGHGHASRTRQVILGVGLRS